MDRTLVGKRKRKPTFEIGREDLEKSVANYLKEGGKIKRITVDDSDLDGFVNHGDPTDNANDFLHGN